MNVRNIDSLAYLRVIRNVKRGLETRSKIIRVLKRRKVASISEISKIVNLSYSAVRRQLIIMEQDGVVMRVERKWKLTGKGQKSLDPYLRVN